jgi:hypothetical protein
MQERDMKLKKKYDFSFLSIRNILSGTLTCGPVRYKRKIQNREIQSKRVLGLDV